MHFRGAPSDPDMGTCCESTRREPYSWPWQPLQYSSHLSQQLQDPRNPRAPGRSRRLAVLLLVLMAISAMSGVSQLSVSLPSLWGRQRTLWAEPRLPTDTLPLAEHPEALGAGAGRPLLQARRANLEGGAEVSAAGSVKSISASTVAASSSSNSHQAEVAEPK